MSVFDASVSSILCQGFEQGPILCAVARFLSLIATPRLIILTLLVPELRIYRFFDRPVGPHPVAMFEVNIFTPAQFGAFIPWLVINRGPLSALVHPNTIESEEKRNHTQRATWLGDRIPLDLRIFN